MDYTHIYIRSSTQIERSSALYLFDRRYIYNPYILIKNAALSSFRNSKGTQIVKRLVRYISPSSPLTLEPLYEPQTSEQLKVFRNGGLTCVDVYLTALTYMGWDLQNLLTNSKPGEK